MFDRSIRPGRRLAVLLGVFLVVFAVADSAFADPVSGSRTAWQISQSTLPTNLVPESEAPPTSDPKSVGPVYRVKVVNIGGKASDPGTIVSDTLPSTVTIPSGAEPALYVLGLEGEVRLPCTVVG